MAVVTQEILIARPPEACFDVIVDYARYPEFVPGIKGCRPLPGGGSPRRVEYELDLGIKRVKYVLAHVEVRPATVRWSLESGDLMKVSNGSWDLHPDAAGTRAVYAVEIQISKPPFIPQAVIDRVSDELTRVQLPRTLEAFKARIEARR
jgi:coenzyme Q-binding protein COQ10